MIKLLLVTWNVEGHEILDIEETEPQLAYVAYWMTKKGQQTISADELNSCLIDARKQMPEILGYTKVSPAEFIKRVELRSSLLIMSGHKRLDNVNTTAVYEFLHLSFQEYLTAKAIVKKFIPQSDIEDKVVDIIKPNVNNENWKEVIPLVAVLLERDTKDLIEYLIFESKQVSVKDKKERIRGDNLAPLLLGSCLANEIQINPDLLGIAIEWYAKNAYSYIDNVNKEVILKNKFGTEFRRRVRECFFEKYDDKYISPLGSTLGEIFLIDYRNSDNKNSISDKVFEALKSDSKEDKCTAILGLMMHVFSFSRHDDSGITPLPISEEVFSIMFKLLRTNDPHYHYSICWCVAWSGDKNIFPNKFRIPFVKFLVKAWIKAVEYNYKRITSWALSNLLTPSIPINEISKIRKIKAAIQENYQKPANEIDKLLSIYLGAIIGESFSKKEVEEVFEIEHKRKSHSNGFYQFAEFLGINLKRQAQTKLLK